MSLNVNGIRAANRKGFFEWLDDQNIDIACLQEVRAWEEQLTDEIYWPKDYHCTYVQAKKKGYSGVGIYSKHQPKKVVKKLGFELADDEGRYVHLEYDDLIVASLYMPSGGSGELRQDLKYDFMDEFYSILAKLKRRKKSIIICGDWNIAHKKIDIKNWRSNQNNSGFLPDERSWMDKLIDKAGWVDAFRVVNQEPDQYTWWSNRARAWDNNVGWRIDYQIISPELKQTVVRAEIYKEQRFSDHSPLIVDYDL